MTGVPRPGGVPLDDQHRPEVCWKVLAQVVLRQLLQRQQRRGAGSCACVPQVSVKRWAEDALVRWIRRGEVCGLGAGATNVGCPSCRHGIQEQGHLLLLGWLCCPRPEKVSQKIPCGPASPGPVRPSHRLPKVCDLPAM